MKRMYEAVESLRTSEDEKDRELLNLMIIKDRAKIKVKFKDSLSLVYSGKATSIVVESDKDLKALFNYLFRLAVNEDCTIEYMFSKPDSDVPEDNFEVFISACDYLITHSARVDDVTSPKYNFIARPKVSEYGITSFDATDSRPFYWLGNPADSMRKYFWTTDFAITDNAGGSERTCFASLIAKKHPVVIEALSGLNIPEAFIERILSRASEKTRECLPDYAYKKQVLIPAFDDEGEVTDYLAITPMASLALSDSIIHALNRFRERHRTNTAEKDKDERPEYPFHMPTPRQFLQFGGDHPKNVSDFANSVSGFHPCLRASIPNIKMDKSIEGRVEKNYLILNLSPQSNTEANHIDVVIKFAKQEPWFARQCKAYLSEVFRPVHYYAQVIQTAYDQEVGKAKESKEPFDGSAFEMPMPKASGRNAELKALVLKCLTEERLNEEDIESYTQVLHSAIQKQAVKKSTHTKAQHKILNAEITSFLRSWTCPVRRIYG